MLLIISTYTAELARIEPHRKTHSEWVSKYIDRGIFLLAGPKKTKSGGVILAKSIDKEELKTILSEDSYEEAGVVESQIVEFDCVLSQPELAQLSGI